MTECSHTFCRQCITRWAEESPGGGCPKCRKPLQVTGMALRSDLRLKEVGSRESVRRLRLIFSQEIDDLMVKCSDLMCSWVGRKADYISHWMAACPIRGTPRRRFMPFYDVLQGTESDSTTLVMESRESSVCPFRLACQLFVSKP